MIRVSSIILTSDNSGVKSMKCVNVLGSSRNTRARLGDLVRVCLKRARFAVNTLKKEVAAKKRILEKKKLYTALLVAAKTFTRRRSGTYIRFNNTRGLLLTSSTTKKQKYKFVGSRIRGPICKEVYRPRNYADLKGILSYISTLV
jgi:large subunit ribosomal protein L14